MASILNTVRDLERLRQIVLVLVRHGFGEVVQRTGLGSLVGKSAATEEGKAKAKISVGERLRLVMQDLGPSFVKLGQIVSTRADVIPPDVGPLTDVAALLKLGAQNGFFIASFAGLARTFFSDYRKTRAALGLAHYSEDEMLALLSAAGYDARRRESNLGHNQARMAFIAVPK